MSDAGASAVAVAVTFVWLGMVLAISFLEAPLKFRAPNVTVPIGLGIGRLVFRALNLTEAVLAAAVAGAALAREDLPRSRAHLAYVALEIAKVVALAGLGASLLYGATW